MRAFAVLAAALALARPALAGSVYNNCSGAATKLPGATAQESLPQLSGRGWETWELSVSEAVNATIVLFSWQKGDPAAAVSDSAKAKFSVNALFFNGTHLNTTVEGTLKSSAKDGVYSISIGKNKLVWTDALNRYNVSVDANGFTADLTTELLPGIPFKPQKNGKDGVLVDGLHVSVPMPRGHIDGDLAYPSGERWLVQNVASLKHAYAKKPIQALVKSYTRIATWNGPTAPAVSLNALLAESASGVNTTSAHLSNALPYDTLLYEVTDDTTLSVSGNATAPVFTFAGCPQTAGSPDVHRPSRAVHVADFTDCAGGVTSWYTAAMTASIPFNGTVFEAAAGIGFFETYTAPKSLWHWK